MASLRLYKKFYLITNDSSLNSQSYDLINPYFLEANTYEAGTGATESNILIEANLPISQDSIGVYFATLDSNLYSVDTIYDLVWSVQYVVGAPSKKISTRFRLATPSSRIVNQLEAEIIGQTIEIEILNQSLEFEIK
jgi:hypothetical protein